MTAVNDITDLAFQYKLKNEKKHDTDTRTSKRRAHSADEREAVYPEYRALILLLNAYAVTDSEPDRYAALIFQLNNNIDYVKIHAMTSPSQEGCGIGSPDFPT